MKIPSSHRTKKKTLPAHAMSFLGSRGIRYVLRFKSQSKRTDRWRCSFRRRSFIEDANPVPSVSGPMPACGVCHGQHPRLGGLRHVSPGTTNCFSILRLILLARVLLLFGGSQRRSAPWQRKPRRGGSLKIAPIAVPNPARRRKRA